MILRMDGLTKRQHNLALADVSDAVGAAGGWIRDHHVYSNKMAAVAFEVPAAALTALAERLRRAELKVSFADPAAAERIAGKDGDVGIHLSLTFLGDEPDLRRDVPAFG